jgi:RimJ/RimL family protein N-acetyltransferase
MTPRHEYTLYLPVRLAPEPPVAPPSLGVRAARAEDAAALAELMLDAYRGTIDYDGETLEEAQAEVQAYLAGERGGTPYLEASRLGFVGETLVTACLVGDWEERQQPLVAYVMTRARWKNRGLGTAMAYRALEALARSGHSSVRAVVTEGNLPSERLAVRLGFQRVSGSGDEAGS